MNHLYFISVLSKVLGVVPGRTVEKSVSTMETLLTQTAGSECLEGSISVGIILLSTTCNMAVVKYHPKMLEADRQEQGLHCGAADVEPLEGEVSHCSCHCSIDCV